MLKIVDDIIQEYLKAHKSASWLICGPKGIGKKEIVQYVATSLLGNNSGDLLSGLKWVECGLTDESKKILQKTLENGEQSPVLSELEYKSEITMDEMKSALDFISLKSTLPCKILAISLAEEMNENVQNALLKTLEEPPEKTLIFLLSENQNHLLPTILSRCKRIVLHTLSDQEMREKIEHDFPQCSDISMTIKLAQGIPAIAKKICDYDGIHLYKNLNQFFCPIDSLNLADLMDFLNSKNAQENALIEHFILTFLYQQAQTSDLSRANDLSMLYTWTENQLQKAQNLYLDKNQVLFNIILKIAENLK